MSNQNWLQELEQAEPNSELTYILEYCNSDSRMLNPSAVYSINPVTEDVARHMAEQFQTKPIESWDIRTMQEKLLLLTEKRN